MEQVKLFKEFKSIENSYRTAYINKVIDEGQSGGNWVVTNKIHGSNFSFILTSDSINGAKRTQMLRWDENFNNWQKVYKKLEDNLKQLQAFLFKSETRPVGRKVLRVNLFGEIFGGTYPHPDVPESSEWKKVQKEVKYSPENEFLAFDMFIVCSDPDGTISSEWVSYANFKVLCTACGIPMVDELLVGTFTECLNHPNDFQDPTHKKYGLPSLENNITEGVVIRPYDEVKRFNNGEVITLKNKNDKSKEVKEPKQKFIVTDEIIAKNEEEKQTIKRYVTEQRLRNVLSKIGDVTEKDFGKVLTALCTDVKDEFFKDYDVKEYGQIMGKWLSKLCAELIRENFLNIIDGNF